MPISSGHCARGIGKPSTGGTNITENIFISLKPHFGDTKQTWHTLIYENDARELKALNALFWCLIFSA